MKIGNFLGRVLHNAGVFIADTAVAVKDGTVSEFNEFKLGLVDGVNTAENHKVKKPVVGKRSPHTR